MACAEDFDVVQSGLFFWQAYDPKVKVDLSCCARLTGKGLVFIDPIPLAKDALAALTQEATPAAIVLTSGNHERAAREYRELFGIPVWAHRETQDELGDGCVDHVVNDGEAICEDLEVITLPGGAPGEIALIGRNTLHVGDALINLPDFGFDILPDKYCANAKELRRSLEKLLSFRFEALTFAHGLPVVAHAWQRLSQLLA